MSIWHSPLSLYRTKKTGWSKEQEKYRQRGDVLESGAEDHYRQRLNDAEKDAASECAEGTAEAADNRRDEAANGERHAEIEGSIFCRCDQHAGETSERGA